MDFISNKKPQIEEMLKLIGINSIEELFKVIPSNLRLEAPREDDGLSEYEGLQLMESIAAKNTFSQRMNFLGAGSYEHHIPALVDAICSKSEFLTAYTPYQPEASQGMLQVIFEFQSAICALTGLDVANASLYDGASACAEAMLMALRLKKDCDKVIIADSLHPLYRKVVEQYLYSHKIKIEMIPFLSNGTLDFERFSGLIDSTTAAVLVSYPNFFGVIDNIKKIQSRAKASGALTVVCANPLVYGLYASAAEIGADIAVGDCQPFGLPLQFGGPYVGYIACRQEFIRQLPGRLAGETRDLQGRRGFVLTFQAREQHIRREKATSNICSNQALAALACLIAILWYGKKGIRKLALTNYQRTAYLREKLSELPGVQVRENISFFNEFVVKFPCKLEKMFKHFHQHGIEPGFELGRFYPELSEEILVAVTETKSKQQLDQYVAVAKELLD